MVQSEQRIDPRTACVIKLTPSIGLSHTPLTPNARCQFTNSKPGRMVSTHGRMVGAHICLECRLLDKTALANSLVNESSIPQ